MQSKKIFAIKFVHSVVFFYVIACILYILYCAIARRYDWTLLVALGSIFVEGLALLLNRWSCPFTTFAEKHGALNGSVTDIFLPAWLTRQTFKIGTVVVIIELLWLVWGYFTR